MTAPPLLLLLSLTLATGPSLSAISQNFPFTYNPKGNLTGNVLQQLW